MPEEDGLFEPGQRVDEGLLDVSREAHRVAVDVDLVDVQPLGLEEQLMPLAVRKAHHLVLERRTVARADAADLPVEEGRRVDVAANELVHAIGRVQEMTVDLRAIDPLRS